MILILGGSFDPVHEGHLHLIRLLCEGLNPETLYVVPTKQNPLKDSVTASADQRKEMLKLAIEELNLPNVILDERELKREGQSFTIDTVQEFQSETGKEISLVIGNELYPDLPQWKEPVSLLSKANLIIVSREKSTFDPTIILAALGMFAVRKENNRWYHSKGKWIELYPIEAIPISSTKIREETSQRFATNHLDSMPQGLQRSSWQYIKENRLYAVKR